MARGGGQRGLRARNQAVPEPARVANSAVHHLRGDGVRARVSIVAAHGIRSRVHHSAGLRQRQRHVGDRVERHGARLVQLHPAHHRHHRPARHDPEHPRADATSGLTEMMMTA